MGLLQQELQRAIESGEFIPNFQPLVELRSGRLEGFEILARWQHPVLGLLMPSDFVPIIERYSLAFDLTSCLLKQAFVAMRDMPDHLGLSINAAPEQFRDRILSQTINSLASEAGFDLRRLTVELTESALVDDLLLAGTIAEELKALGIRLALDDFGTGYSSLLHLQALPFDELKVDRSFVASMVDSSQSRKIVAAVLGLGKSLGLRTVAEGIEHAEQRELLTWQGCNTGQGWFFGKAVGAEELHSLAIQQLIRATAVEDSYVAEPVKMRGPRKVERANVAGPVLKIPAKPLTPLAKPKRRTSDLLRKKLA